MITVMYGAWSNEPKKYDSVNDYLTKNKNLFEPDVNEMIDKYYKGKPHFEMGKTEMDLITDYVARHESEIYPKAKNTYVNWDFNRLIDDAIDSILYNRGYYN